MKTLAVATGPGTSQPSLVWSTQLEARGSSVLRVQLPRVGSGSAWGLQSHLPAERQRAPTDPGLVPGLRSCTDVVGLDELIPLNATKGTGSEVSVPLAKAQLPWKVDSPPHAVLACCSVLLPQAALPLPFFFS